MLRRATAVIAMAPSIAEPIIRVVSKRRVTTPEIITFRSGDAEVIIATSYLVTTVNVAAACVALLPLLVCKAPAGSLLQ